MSCAGTSSKRTRGGRTRLRTPTGTPPTRPVREVDLSTLEPYDARPGGVAHNAVPVSEIEQRPVNQCFIGSCANGQLEDLRSAADVVRGRSPSGCG